MHYILQQAHAHQHSQTMLCLRMRDDRNKTHPVLFSARLHKKLAQTHPFIDGNGRICRLSMNAVLVQNGYPPAIIPPSFAGTTSGLWRDHGLTSGFSLNFWPGGYWKPKKI
jgi:hypothetical protein